MADKYEPGQEFRTWTQVPSLTANQGGILPLIGMFMSAMKGKDSGATPDGAMPPPNATDPGMVPPNGGQPPMAGSPPLMAPAAPSAPATPAYADPNAYMQGNSGVMKIISSLFGMGR
jgi:hypothetical protein